MNKKRFRFKTEYFNIGGIYNIPTLIICSGFGPCFDTYCCKNCGELFVIDQETLYYQKTNIENFVANKTGTKCKGELETNLVKYPENIFYQNRILVNKNEINKTNFENTRLIEVYEIE